MCESVSINGASDRNKKYKSNKERKNIKKRRKKRVRFFTTMDQTAPAR